MCDNIGSKALTMKTMHLSHMMRRSFEEERGQDPRASPWRVLAFLRLAGEASVGDVAMILEAGPHSLERTLSKLVEDGLVVREQGEKRWLDRVKLTEEGRQPGSRPKSKVSKAIEALTEEERGQLAAILDKLNSSLEKELGIPEDPEERKAALRGGHGV
jgi:DNA-binding MarR family transcriptional regulator